MLFSGRSIIPFLISTLILTSDLSLAHEPVFGLGPETIYKGGFGIETELEYEKTHSERKSSLHEEIIYGLRENFSLTLSIPFILEKNVSGSTSSGLGDVALRGKFRFYKKDDLGAQNKVALFGGIKFPFGNKDKKPSIATSSFDYLLGITAGYESLKWYYFGTMRYWFNNKDSIREKGDVFLYDMAVGLRPVLREYYESDIVFLLELNGEHRSKDKVSHLEDKDSGGNILYLGSTFLWSYRNWMIKGGIQVPVYQDLNGGQEKEDFRSVLAVEVHF